MWGWHVLGERHSRREHPWLCSALPLSAPLTLRHPLAGTLPLFMPILVSFFKVPLILCPCLRACAPHTHTHAYRRLSAPLTPFTTLCKNWRCRVNTCSSLPGGLFPGLGTSSALKPCKLEVSKKKKKLNRPQKEPVGSWEINPWASMCFGEDE